MRLRFALLPLLVLASAACEGAGARAPAYAVRDSAGARIVESAAPLWDQGAGWRVAAEPAVDIGVVEGAPEYQLDAVVGAVRHPDGRIVVANGGSEELRVYDAHGRHLRSLGGKGGGPGEFENLAWTGLRGDSVLAWDGRAKRLSTFSPQGEFIRTVALQGLERFFAPHVLGVLADGSVVGTPGDDPGAMMEAPEGEYRSRWTLLRFAPTGELLDTLATISRSERLLSKRDNGFTTAPILFGRETFTAVSPEHLLVGESGSYQVSALGPDGAVVRIVRRLDEPGAVDDAVVESERARRLESFADLPEGPRAAMTATLMEAPHRSTLPAFLGLLADAEGNLWVEDARLPSDEQPRWSVFDPEGRWLGRVETPVGLRIRQIGPDWVLGTWKDDFDVEHVRVHVLSKP